MTATNSKLVQHMATSAADAYGLRTIPKSRTVVAVTAEADSISLADYAGRFIHLEAVTLDVTIRLGAAEVALVAGEGFPIRKDATRFEEFLVDPNDPDQTLTHISSGSASLIIHY